MNPAAPTGAVDSSARVLVEPNGVPGGNRVNCRSDKGLYNAEA